MHFDNLIKAGIFFRREIGTFHFPFPPPSSAQLIHSLALHPFSSSRLLLRAALLEIFHQSPFEVTPD